MNTGIEVTRSRRAVLGAIGAGVGFGSVADVAARPAEDDDTEWGSALPEEKALLAGYSFEDGDVSFEVGRDSLDVGDEIRIMTTADDDGGSRWFHWRSTPYDVSAVAVHCGDRVEYYDADDATSGRVDLDERIDGEIPPIDRVEFGTTVRWQVDFGAGEVPIPPSYWPEYLFAALGTSPGGATENPSAARLTDDVNVELLDDEFEIDGADASIAFEVTGDEPEQLHLASFELPAEFDLDDLDEQVLYDSTVREFEPGQHELTVSLPIPESMDPQDLKDDVEIEDSESSSDGSGGDEEEEEGSKTDGDDGSGSEESSGDDGNEGGDSDGSGSGDSGGDEGADESSGESGTSASGGGSDDDGDAGTTDDDASGDGSAADDDRGGSNGDDAGSSTDDERAGSDAEGDATPGLGIVSALASVGGVGYLLARRTDDEE